MTDITETVLVSLLVPAIDESLARLQGDIETYAKKLIDEPTYVLASSYTDNVYETGAKIKILREVRAHYKFMLETEEDADTLRATCADIARCAWEHAKRNDAVARSTSPASNLMEQHTLQMGLRWLEGRYYDFPEFRQAQRNDTAVKAEWDRRTEEARAYDAMRAEADAENKAFDRRVRRNQRRQA